MEIENFLNGGFEPRRYRPGGVGNWSGHLPFARDLVAASRPSLLVELGTHYGESYFGFCQAVGENDIGCSCYAVDTWVGEPHAGFYGENVYSEVSSYNSANYASFSYLLRTTFDEAIGKFTDESIDILHIDGLHTYEAVSHDLHHWLRKVKPGGIVLMHDVMARHGDFGVWKLWDELARTGQHFIFTHSWGLGVFRKPGSGLPDNGLFKILFDSVAETQEHARKFYALCAIKLERDHEDRVPRRGTDGQVLAHIYPFGSGGYSAETAIKVDVNPGHWEHLSLEIIQGTGNGPLRIDLLEQPGIIDIAGIVLRRPADGEIMWSAKGCGELAALPVGGTAMRFDSDGTRDFGRFFSYGSDPQLLLPALDPERFDQPLLLEIWLRLQTDDSALLAVLQHADQQRSRALALESIVEEMQSAASEQNGHATERDRLALEQAQIAEERSAIAGERSAIAKDRHAVIEERELLALERDQIAKERSAIAKNDNAVTEERDLLLVTLRKLQSDLYVSKVDLKRAAAEEERLISQEERLRSQEERLRSEIAHLQQRIAASEAILHEALNSRSWRITRPVRKLSRLFGAQRGGA